MLEMALHRQYWIECHTCPAHIVLPSRSHQEISPGQWYWPTGETVVWLLCQDCGFVFGYSPRSIHLEEVETEDPSQRPSAFWKVALECDHESCGLRFSVHTRTGADVPRGKAGASIVEAVRAKKNSVTCPAKHVVRFPRSVEIVGVD